MSKRKNSNAFIASMNFAAHSMNYKKIIKHLSFSLFFIIFMAGCGAVVSQQGEKLPIQGQTHIKPGEEAMEYNSNPPTSGAHLSSAANWGISRGPVPDVQAIHNLEHGGIWISYKNLDEESLQKLRDFANKHYESVLLSPREANDSKIAIAAWGYLEQINTLDMEVLENFYKANKNKSPEPIAGK